MKRPTSKKHAECQGCLEHAPLLMPVGSAPGWAIIVWQLLCLKCRLSSVSDQWGIMESDLLHSRHASARAAHAEWLAAEFE